MNGFSEAYKNFPFPLPMLLDGATGTEMIKMGMPSGICPEAWILEHPDALISLQAAYIAAGSDAVLSPTFGANRPILMRYGLEQKVEEMNTSLVKLSKRAASLTNAKIGGDLSPTGHYLSPVGDMDFETLVRIYHEQAAALSPYVDFFFIETNMDLASLRAAVYGVKEASDKPIFVTLTVTKSGMTMSGDSPNAALLTLSALGISAFGLNCSGGPCEMLGFLRPLVPLSLSLGIPLIAKPNAGAGDVHMPAEEFARAVGNMAQEGIAILGGCCGTDKTHIAALRKALDASRFAPPAANPLPVHMLIAGNRKIASVDKEHLPIPLVVSEDLPEEAFEMAEEYGYLYLSLPSRAEADMALEAAPMLGVPIAVCGNKDACSYFCRYYCGRVISL